MKWFQVDSDTPNDPKIKAIIRAGLPTPAGGQAAAGALLLLWCYIADHGSGVPGEGVDGNGLPLPLSEMADECLFDQEAQLATWLDFLAVKRHIDPERWAANKTVVLPAMRTRADSYAKSKGRGDDGRKLARPGKDSPLQDNTNKHDNTEQDPQGGLFALTPDELKVTADDLMKVWNDHRKQGPTIRQLTDDRRRACLTALRLEPNLTRWAALVDWIESQDWMNASGRGEHPNWRADLEFILRPKQVLKLFERMDADLARRGTNGGRNGRTDPEPGKFAQAVGKDDDGSDGGPTG